MDRRTALHALALPALAAAASPVWAQSQPIRIIIPYAAGGITDAMARALGAAMQGPMQRTVIVENRPGAAGLIGTKYVMAANPDGDTLLFHNSGMVALPLLQIEPAYDPLKDFTPVSVVGNSSNFLMVHESVPARNVSELLAYVRTLPNGIECANSGTNSGGHIAALLLAKLGKIKIVHVPYKGSAEVTTGLIRGDVKMQISVTTDALNPHIKSGKIRIIGVATKQRSPLAPEIPTIAETLPGYSLEGWYGIFAPAHTPLAKRQALSDALKVALADPSVKTRFDALFMEVVHRGPKEFAQISFDSVDYFKRMIAELNLQKS